MVANAMPWWQEEADEQCVCCNHPYHLEAMSFCVGCDGPVCRVCVQVNFANGDNACPDCTDQNTEGH